MILLHVDTAVPAAPVGTRAPRVESSWQPRRRPRACRWHLLLDRALRPAGPCVCPDAKHSASTLSALK